MNQGFFDEHTFFKGTKKQKQKQELHYICIRVYKKRFITYWGEKKGKKIQQESFSKVAAKQQERDYTNFDFLSIMYNLQK